MKRILATGILGGLALALPAAASAQGLADLLVDLIASEIRLAPPGAGFPSHEAHFRPGVDQQIAPFFFNQQLVTQLGTVPVGSPAGGFSFTFDPGSGVLRRTSDSFGPAFAERALTNGKGRVTIGANFQYSKYSSFEGQTLDNGDIKFYVRHEDIPGDQFFEGDLVETALSLDLSSATTTLFANYGLTDQWDIALALPLVRVSMDATIDATVLPLATGASSPIHLFPNGTRNASFSRSGTASGIGDLTFRTKYRFLTREGGGLAAGVDLRLPTGDEQDLLGSGSTAVAVTLIGSTTRGQFSPHFNVGYTGATTGDLLLNAPNELGYRFGTEYTVSPAVTLSGTIIGRRLIDVGRLELADTTFTFQGGSTTLREYVLQEGALNLASLAVGGKFNLTRTLLLSANVVVALTSSGVTSRITPVVGLDYSFGK